MLINTLQYIAARDNTFARVSAVEGGWRTNGTLRPKRRLRNFIDGAPRGEGMLQLELDFKDGQLKG